MHIDIQSFPHLFRIVFGGFQYFLYIANLDEFMLMDTNNSTV